MALELELTFDRLPLELLDVITNKVRQSPKSFRALEQTSRGLRDSARRCSKTLVVGSWKRQGRSVYRPERANDHEQTNPLSTFVSLRLTDFRLAKEILSKELSLRPNLAKLKIRDKSYERQETGCLSSVSGLKSLTGFPWEDVEIGGKHGKTSWRTWELEYPQTIVSECANTLKRLTIKRFEYAAVRTIASFLQRFPKLETLTLQGNLLGLDSSDDSVHVIHENLTSLNIANLSCASRGVFLAQGDRHDVPEDAFLSANLPSLRGLSANICDRRSALQCCPKTPLTWEVADFTFPSSLAVLQLYWRHFSYGDFRPASLYPMLQRDCPQLQELHVRMDTPLSKNAKKRSLQWISEQEKLPEGCSELRELSFEMSENKGEWVCVKILGKV